MGSAADYLVAHRGDRAGGVENTLPAFAAAADAGARFMECDIQFSRDLVPLVLHDARLGRLCGRPEVCVSETTADVLRDICRPHFPLLSLDELLGWLGTAPDVTLFVEIKSPIRERLSDRSIVRLVGEAFPEGLRHRLVVIGMSASLVDLFAAELRCPVGWVAEGVRRPLHAMQYVFMPWQRADEMGQWQKLGARIGLYTVNDASAAAHLRRRGADLIESNYFSQMARALD